MRDVVIQKNNRIKEILILVFSFAVPLFVMAAIWGGLGIRYNGEVTPLVFDMKAQYVSFFASLRYILDGSSSLTFSWGTALGGNYLGLFAYYMASPLSWITVLFELENMPNAIYVLTLLKIGLCGLSFSVFLRFGTENGKARWIDILFACCYALMSYNMAYNMCLMWMDGVIFLPLILLGIEKLLIGKKGLVYFASLSGLFISCYYISYMVGIFAAAYILCRALSKITRDNYKSICMVLLRFGINTILALGVAMPLILPGMMNLELGKGALTSGEVNAGWTKTVTVVDVLQKLLPVQYDSIKYEGLPYIYCGSLMLVLALAFFLQKKHSIREKISAVILLLISFSGFVIEQIDYVWHAFAYPNCFLYRYAFLFSAMLLILAYKAYENLSKKTELMKTLFVIGTLYTCAELYLNGAVVVGGVNEECNYNAKVEYDFYYQTYEPMVQKIKEDNDWFRMDMDMPYYTYNDPLFFGLNGISYFSSTFHDGINDFLRSMGAKDYYIHTSGTGLTPVVDSILGVKYRISKQDTKTAYLEVKSPVDDNEMFALFENPNAMSLGFLIDSTKLVDFEKWGENPLDNQNKLLEILGGGGIFYTIPHEREVREERKEYVFRFEVVDENPVYLFVNASLNTSKENADEVQGVSRNIKIYVNDELVIDEDAALGRRVYELGCFEAGESVAVVVKGEYVEYKEEYICSMDLQQYQIEMERLNACQPKLNVYDDGSVSGEVTAHAGEVLLMSIPYDSGYRVQIDGKEVESMVALNTFLAVQVPEGVHYIEVSYVPPGAGIGVILGIGSVILLFLYYGRLFCNGVKNQRNIR